MDFTIFYAWQSDRIQKTNRYLIRDAAKEAVSRIGNDADIEDSPRLDHDTRSISGTPEIAGTIYRKIQDSGIFLADLTFVGLTGIMEGRQKLLPNPNVMLEVGYAARCIGWDRIVCVMNTTFGPAEELPFDLQHRRWPICYELADGDHEAIRKTRKDLGEQIEGAIRSPMASEHQAVEDASRRLSAETIMFMGWHAHHDSFWRDIGELTVIQAAATGFIDRAVDRLLDLRLIDCVFHPDLNKYVYRWTYIGKLVLKKLDIKHEADPGESEMATENLPKQITTEDPSKETRQRFQEMSFRERLLRAFFPKKLADH